MTIGEMRRKLANTEPYCNSPSWKDRVYRMPDNQVYMVHRSFLKYGRYDKKPKDLKDDKTYKQLNIFDVYGPDIIGGKNNV